MKVNWVKLVISESICLGAGIIGSVFTAPNIPTWYAGLAKPWFNPPSWVFGPVWTTLFILMGISLYLVWNSQNKLRSQAIKLFYIQLALNVAWSVIFFGLTNPLFALAEIFVLWSVIVLTWEQFRRINNTAARLLLPYLAWVSFAAFLNLSIVLLNPSGLTRTPGSAVVALQPKYQGNYTLDFRLNPNSPCVGQKYIDNCLYDFYLKDQVTKKEILMLSTDMYLDSRQPTFTSGYLFLIKRIGIFSYKSDVWNNWTDELWVYTDQVNGKKLFTQQGLEYISSPDAGQVAIAVGPYNPRISFQVISVTTGSLSKVLTFDKVQCHSPLPETETTPGMESYQIQFHTWSKDSRELWGAVTGYPITTLCFWKYSPDTGAAIYYPVPENTGFLYLFNPDSLFAIHVGKPVFLAVTPDMDKWYATHTTYPVLLYNLVTQKTRKIIEVPARSDFTAIGWDSPDTLRYQTSEGIATYTIPK